MATKANTRQKRKEDLIKQRRNRLLVARPHIFKFLNPSTSYKITDNYYFNEELFSSDETSVDAMVPLFEWNRISQAKIFDDFLRFQFVPIRREFQLNTSYVVDRLKSFGEMRSMGMAVQIANLIESQSRFKLEHADCYLTSAQIVKRLEGKNYIMFGGRFTENGPRQCEMYISKGFISGVGMLSEKLMLDAVKYGKAPIGLMSNMTHMSETMVQYLRMMIMYNTLAAQGNKQALQQLVEAAKAETIMSFQTLDKVQKRRLRQLKAR